MRITTNKPEGIILSAVTKYEEFVSPTYGPAGKKTLIINSEFSHEAVDDGRRSSEAFELEDERENAVVQYVKETTQKGKDGTTTAAILMSSIVKDTLKDYENDFAEKDRHGTALSLRKGLKEAVSQIKDISKPIKTKKELEAIAYNSYNDEHTAKLVAETVHRIGRDGILAVEDSKLTETTVEVVNGLEIHKGYFSPYFINDGENAVIENPAILIVNKKINLFAELAPVIQKLTQSGKKEFVILAEGFGDDVLNKCVVYRSMGAFVPLLVEAPGVGDRLENMQDVAAVVGATVIDDKLIKLSEATVEHFGSADTVKATRDKTTFLGGKGKTKEYLDALRTKHEESTSDFDKDKTSRRIAAISGGVAVIKVGAYTENEQKATKAKVENAVAAAQIAFRGGVVPGAGKTMASIKTSSEVLNSALKAPRKKLEENGAKYLDEDAVDPAEVVITALEAAVSIAVGLITMGGVSVPKRKRDRDNQPLSF